MHPDEQAIRDLIATWCTATMAGESNTVLNMIADDALLLAPGQPPMTRADFAAGQQGLAQWVLQIDWRIDEIQLLGNDWAWSRCYLTVSMTPREGGAAITHAGNTLTLLRKTEGRWLLVRDANLLATVEGEDTRH